MTDEVDRLDEWLNEDGPAALTLREHLAPVDGEDGIIFPPTFAGEIGEGRQGSTYVVDELRGGKSCLVDSVGSQANRIEPVFQRDPYSGLVPQIIIRAGDQEVNLLQVGHRAADAAVRFSGLTTDLDEAFQVWVRKKDASKLARIAPTSLVFGAWDSRRTGAKIPRALTSVIRAYDVEVLTRKSQYIPPLEYDGVVEDAIIKDDEKAGGELGLGHVPAAKSGGGIIVRGGIRRDAVLNLAAIRALGADEAAERLNLIRYVFGLALVALSAPMNLSLRQGCILVRKPDKPVQVEVVQPDGKREPTKLDHQAFLKYAVDAARRFGVGEGRTVDFDPKQVRTFYDQKDKKKQRKGKGEKGSS